MLIALPSYAIRRISKKNKRVWDKSQDIKGESFGTGSRKQKAKRKTVELEENIVEF